MGLRSSGKNGGDVMGGGMGKVEDAGGYGKGTFSKGDNIGYWDKIRG